ncbi:MAG: hypothetical protein PUP92_27905 [Rhizonema sp. PD38]|nr:hypothetical protein [Rhizonema sp. PD38]
MPIAKVQLKIQQEAVETQEATIIAFLAREISPDRPRVNGKIAVLLERNKQYRYHKQLLIFSHTTINTRGSKIFTFRTARGAWKNLSRNQMQFVDAVKPIREGFTQ